VVLVLRYDVDIITRHGSNVSNMVYWVDKIKSFLFRLKVSGHHLHMIIIF
jgi:hypothetical protein